MLCVFERTNSSQPHKHLIENKQDNSLSWWPCSTWPPSSGPQPPGSNFLPRSIMFTTESVISIEHLCTDGWLEEKKSVMSTFYQSLPALPPLSRYKRQLNWKDFWPTLCCFSRRHASLETGSGGFSCNNSVKALQKEIDTRYNHEVWEKKFSIDILLDLIESQVKTCWDHALGLQCLIDQAGSSSCLSPRLVSKCQQPWGFIHVLGSFVQVWETLKFKKSLRHLWSKLCVVDRGGPTPLALPTMVAPVEGGVLWCRRRARSLIWARRSRRFRRSWRLLILLWTQRVSACSRLELLGSETVAVGKVWVGPCQNN